MSSSLKICDLAQKLVADIESSPIDFVRYLSDNPTLIRRVATHRIQRPEPDCHYYWSPVHAAARHGRLDMLEVFAKSSCQLEAPDERKRVAVWYAARYGHAEVLKFMLQCGVKYKHGDCDGWSPLHAASRYGHIEIVRLLVCQDSPVNHHDLMGWTPLHKAVWGDHMDVCQYLVRFGASVNAATYNDRISPLHLACYRMNLPAAKLFLTKSSDISQPNYKGITPLMIAAQMGCYELVDYLLFSGASATERTGSHSTALHYAAEAGHVSVANLLLKRGAKCDQCNRTGWTPFLLAARHGHTALCRLLRIKGASISSVLKPHNYNALHLACMSGNTDTVHYLIVDLGLSVHQPDGKGRTSVHLCSLLGFSECVEILLKGGAAIGELDQHGRSPVHLAATAGYVNLAKLLIRQGASLWEAVLALLLRVKLKAD